MLSLEIAADVGSGSRERHPNSILYSILSGRNSGYLDGKPDRSRRHNCHCEGTRTVGLKDPKVTYQVASSLMVQTFCFIQGLPSFCQLPSEDQALLLRHCWVHLFVLGLAQQRIALEVTEAPDSSILRQILLGPGLTEQDHHRPTLAEVHRLRTIMNHLWTLGLGPKEYAYLKGALLFNPAVPGLRASTVIRGLQKEAQGALREVVHLLHPGDASRFSRVLLAASSVQSVSHQLVSQLLLKPVLHDTFYIY
eukprot:XP_003969163.1 PREDICTED: nuclear receptor subfamily 0 group B member 2-like [Takifugu rubripes]